MDLLRWVNSLECVITPQPDMRKIGRWNDEYLDGSISSLPRGCTDDFTIPTSFCLLAVSAAMFLLRTLHALAYFSKVLGSLLDGPG